MGCPRSEELSGSWQLFSYGKTRMFGQLLGLFPRFVQRWGDCPYMLKKIWRDFLEFAYYRRNFAATKD